jgi:hypothetical protein
MMNKVLISAMAALTLASTGAALAADPQDATVQIRASEGNYKLKIGEFDDYANRYALDNGYKIRFQRYAKHYYAQLSGELREEMFPVEPGVFMTAAGTRVQFKDQGDMVEIANFERLQPSLAATGMHITVIARR